MKKSKSPQNQKLLGELNQKAQRVRNNDVDDLRRLELLDNFYRGRQSLSRSYDLRGNTSYVFDYDDKSISFNFCGPYVDRIHGAANKKRPVFVVSAPESEGRREFKAAKALSRLLKNMYVKQGWDREWNKAFANCPKLGNGCMYLRWNLQQGEKIIDRSVGEDGAMTVEEIPVGLPEWESINPNQIHLPPNWVHEEISRAPWALIARVVGLPDIKRDYRVEATEDHDTFAFREGSDANQQRDLRGDPYRLDDTGADYQATVVWEYLERASEEHPSGRHCLFTKTELLYSDELPFDWCEERGRLPLVWINYKEDDQRLTSEGIIDQLFPLQYIYNDLANERVAAAHKQSDVRPMWPADAGFDEEAFEIPGKPIVYSSGARQAPAYLMPAPESPSVGAVTELIESNGRRMAGMNELLMGDNPDGVRGIAHAAFMNEMTYIALLPFIYSKERALKLGGEMTLWSIREKMPEKVAIKLCAPVDSAGIRAFMKYGESADFQLTVPIDSLIPKSALIQNQDTMEKYEAGFYGQPGTPEAVAAANDAMDYYSSDYPDKIRELNENMVELEHQQIEELAIELLEIKKRLKLPPTALLPEGYPTKNRMPIPKEVEDRAIHLSGHDEFALENSDDRDPLQAEIYRLTVDVHVRMTEMQISLQQQGMNQGEVYGQLGTQPALPSGGSPQMAGMGGDAPSMPLGPPGEMGPAENMAPPLDLGGPQFPGGF